MPPKRPRTLAREAAREAKKLVEAKERLAALETGGSPERPIELVSASLVEPRALQLGCLACNGTLELVDHRVTHVSTGLLREIVMRCRRCTRARTAWVQVVATRAH